MAYDITLEGGNLKKAEELLENVARIFNQCKIAYWLEGGTLLGIRRENRLLPWDNDVDISMMQDQLNKIDILIRSLQKAGYRIRIRRFDKDSDFFRKGDIRMIKIRTKHFMGFVKGKVCLDIFVKYPKDENAYWEIDNKTKYVPLKFYRSFKKITFKNFEYSIPEFTEQYLTYRYGNWETPVKEWDTSKDDNALA